MAPAQQKYASKLPQQWQQWQDRIWQCNTVSFGSNFKMYALFSCHLHLIPAVKHEPCLLTMKKKRSRLSRPSARGNFSAFPTWITKPTTGCGARSASLWVHRSLVWLLSRDGNLHGSGMSHVTTTSPNPFFRAPRRPWSAEEMLDGQHQKLDIPARARTAHKGLLQKRLEEDLC